MRAAAVLRACVGGCALAWICVAGAVPFVVQLGADRLVLDTPAGFADTLGLGSPRLNELAESLAGASIRVLSFGITDGDMRRFMTGETPEFKRYVVAGTAREFERLRATQEDFKTFVADALRGLGEAPPKGSDPRKVLGAAAEGKPVLLEFLRRDDSVASYIQGTRLAGAKRSWANWETQPAVYVLVSTSLVMVRGRPINLSITMALEDAADIEWLEINTRRWLERIQSLNP